MGVRLNTLVRFLNYELEIKSIKDQSKNGLQFKGSAEVNKVALATDACMEVFERAKSLGCQLIIVHHGIFWKDQDDITNITKKRLDFLKKNNISLYAAHLPLDKSKKYGHNIHLLEILGIKAKKSFGGVGYFGSFNSPKDLKTIVKKIEEKLNADCKVWSFGKKRIKNVAVVSGAGSGFIPEAIKKKIDLFITGEVFSWAYHTAEEGKLNVIIAGHYKTEVSGVKDLGKILAQKFDLKTFFIDVPSD